MRVQWKALGSNWHVETVPKGTVLTPQMMRQIASKRGIAPSVPVVFGPAQC